MFLGKHSELASKCPDANSCSEQRLIDQYRLYGTISPISFGVGVAGTVAGIWLLLSNKAAEKPAQPSAVAVAPYVSIGHLGLTGAF